MDGVNNAFSMLRQIYSAGIGIENFVVTSNDAINTQKNYQSKCKSIEQFFYWDEINFSEREWKVIQLSIQIQQNKV